MLLFYVEFYWDTLEYNMGQIIKTLFPQIMESTSERFENSVEITDYDVSYIEQLLTSLHNYFKEIYL